MQRLTNFVFLVLVVLERSDPSICSTQMVSINSTLIRGQFAFPGQQVTFTCVATNTTLLEWYSDEYIGPNGDLLPISSFGQARNRTRGSTVATRVGVNIVNGITTIASKLHITASDDYPASSVTCGINNVGPHQRVNFTTTDVVPPDVQLTSNLNEGNFAYNGQTVTFQCVVRGTGHILSWISEDYIGSGGYRLEVVSIHNPGRTYHSPMNPNTIATLNNTSTDANGVIEIVSELQIIASMQYQTSSVRCRINDSANTIDFQAVAAPPKTTTEQQQGLTTVRLEVAVAIPSFVIVAVVAVVALVAVVTVVAVVTFLRSRRKPSATPGDKNSSNSDRKNSPSDKNLLSEDDESSPTKNDKNSLNKDDKNSPNNDLLNKKA